MLQSIFDALSNIADFFVTITTFVFDLIRDLRYMLTALIQVTYAFPQNFGWLPVGVSALVITILSVAIIYKVIGRQ